jgi:hypothetical protein
MSIAGNRHPFRHHFFLDPLFGGFGYLLFRGAKMKNILGILSVFGVGGYSYQREYEVKLSPLQCATHICTVIQPTMFSIE